MRDRIKQLKLAVNIERDTEILRYRTLIEEESIKDRIQAGITLYPIEFNAHSFNDFEALILTFKIDKNQGEHQFSSNGKINLFSANSTEKAEGVIVSLKRNVITIQLFENELPTWIKDGKIGINAIPDTKTIDVMLKTLTSIEQDEIRIANQFYNESEKKPYGIPDTIDDLLNISQNKALNEVLSSNPFHIIHGPPGTGKTHTLVRAISKLVKEGKRILVAAPSNAAVDHITAEIAKENQTVLRLGNSFKIKNTVLQYTLDYKTLNDPLSQVVKRLKKEAEQVRKKAFQYKRNFDKEAYQERKKLRSTLKDIRKDIRAIERDISNSCIEKATVITGTFMALQHERIQNFNADIFIVDEAGQALEPAIWSVARFAPRLILAGDSMQLRPTLFSEKSMELGLAISLLEKGMEIGIPTTLLDVQYRMNDVIMQFSNQMCYDNQLSSDQTIKNLSLLNEIHKPLEFIDTAGCGFDETNDESGGIYNLEEINLIKKRLDELQIDHNSIGIISPYRKQISMIQEFVTSNAIYAQTIDSFQGQERDIIFISLVRSNSANAIGFLSDYRRMNVALTRAKKKLIIIGDSATLGNHSFYQKLLDYVEKYGAYRSAWEYA